MKRSQPGFPIFLPLAVFLFDIFATVLLLGHEARAFPGHYGLVLLPGSLFCSGGAAVSINVGLAGLVEWLSRLAVILVIVVGTIRLVGSHANTVFSQAASAVQ